jgi:VanZ family protein
MRRHVPLLLFVLFLLYGSLYPFSGWQWPDGGFVSALKAGSRRFSRTDLITNFLVYIPLGALVARIALERLRPVAAAALAACAGTALSLVLECVQAWLPGRVPSLIDMLANGGGALAGAAGMAMLGDRTAPGRWAASLRARWFLDGPLASIGIAVLAAWALSQLLPLVPSGSLREGLRPLWQALQEPSRISLYGTAACLLNTTGLGLVAFTVVRPGRNWMGLFYAFAASVLLLKVPVLGRHLSPEAVIGLAASVPLLSLLERTPRRALLAAAFASIVIAFVIQEAEPLAASVSQKHVFNLIPFRAHMFNFRGLVDIAHGIWPFMALAYLTLSARPSRPMLYAYSMGLALLGLTVGLEYAQSSLGHHQDITDVLLPLAGWLLPWLVLGRRAGG